MKSPLSVNKSLEREDDEQKVIHVNLYTSLSHKQEPGSP